MRKKLTIGIILALVTGGILFFISRPFNKKDRGTEVLDLSKAGTHTVKLPMTCCGAPLWATLVLPSGEYSDDELLSAIDMECPVALDPEGAVKWSPVNLVPSFWAAPLGKQGIKLSNTQSGTSMRIHVQKDLPRLAGRPQILVFSQPACIMSLVFLPIAAAGAFIALITGIMSLTYLVRAYKMWRKAFGSAPTEAGKDAVETDLIHS